jgi:hypothetical protein
MMVRKHTNSGERSNTDAHVYQGMRPSSARTRAALEAGFDITSNSDTWFRRQ